MTEYINTSKSTQIVNEERLTHGSPCCEDLPGSVSEISLQSPLPVINWVCRTSFVKSEKRHVLFKYRSPIKIYLPYSRSTYEGANEFCPSKSYQLGQFHQANQNPGASKVTASCEMFVSPEQSASVFL